MVYGPTIHTPRSNYKKKFTVEWLEWWIPVAEGVALNTFQVALSELAPSWVYSIEQ